MRCPCCKRPHAILLCECNYFYCAKCILREVHRCEILALKKKEVVHVQAVVADKVKDRL